MVEVPGASLWLLPLGGVEAAAPVLLAQRPFVGCKRGSYRRVQRTGGHAAHKRECGEDGNEPAHQPSSGTPSGGRSSGRGIAPRRPGSTHVTATADVRIEGYAREVCVMTGSLIEAQGGAMTQWFMTVRWAPRINERAPISARPLTGGSPECRTPLRAEMQPFIRRRIDEVDKPAVNG